MSNKFSRTELLLGKDNMEKLKNSHIAVFGIGGVGSYVIEALVRAGVGEFSIIDKDIVSESNINRQIIATEKTIGSFKTDVAKDRMFEINSSVKINSYKIFLNKDTISDFKFEDFDYIIDAIDTISAKILLAEKAKELNIKIISSMGTANKLDPTKLEVSTIKKTSTCPLAKVMRHELKQRGIDDLKVVYSKELPIKVKNTNPEALDRKSQFLGSVSFVPSSAGLLIASEVVKDIINLDFIS